MISLGPVRPDQPSDLARTLPILTASKPGQMAESGYIEGVVHIAFERAAAARRSQGGKLEVCKIACPCCAIDLDECFSRSTWTERPTVPEEENLG